MGDRDARVAVRKIGKQPARFVEDLGSHWNAELDVITLPAMHVLPPAVRPAPGSEPALALEIREVAQVRVRGENHVTARTAVAAIRAALRNIFLPPEAERPIAAAAPAHLDARAVVEHRAVLFSRPR